MEKAKKRFVISFSESVESPPEIAKILLIEEDQLLDSVDYYQGAQELSKEDIVFYEGLNQVSMELSNAEAENLRKTKGIFAVEEDFELTIAEANGIYPPEQLEFLKNGRRDARARHFQDEFNYAQFVNRERNQFQDDFPRPSFDERRARSFKDNWVEPEYRPDFRNEHYRSNRAEQGPPTYSNQYDRYPNQNPSRFNYNPYYDEPRGNGRDRNWNRENQRWNEQRESNYQNRFQNAYSPSPVSNRMNPNAAYYEQEEIPQFRERSAGRFESRESQFSQPRNSRAYQVPPPRKRAELNWNMKVIEASESWTEVTGKGVNVAVFDTGVANHADLDVYDGVSFVPYIKNFNDEHGHGTHVAGIIAARNKREGNIGVAPDAKIFAVKILDEQGKGKMSWLLAGISWAIRTNMNVISIGCTAPRERVAAFDVAFEKCIEAGITVVCAAGNSNNTEFSKVNAPANSFGAIAVGAIDQNYRIAEFSSRGGEDNPITITAPGTGIISTNLENGFYRKSGSSMASPHVAGLAALIKEKYPTIDPEDLKDRIVQTASDLGYPENDSVYGAGLLNCFRAIQ